MERPTNWKSVTEDIFKWESPGQILEGIYQQVQQRDFGERVAKLYTLNVDGDQVIRFWGSTVLDKRLARVPKGAWVQITYKGEAGQGNRRYKNFDVRVNEETRLVLEKDEDSIPF